MKIQKSAEEIDWPSISTDTCLSPFGRVCARLRGVVAIVSYAFSNLARINSAYKICCNVISLPELLHLLRSRNVNNNKQQEHREKHIIIINIIETFVHAQAIAFGLHKAFRLQYFIRTVSRNGIRIDHIYSFYLFSFYVE